MGRRHRSAQGSNDGLLRYLDAIADPTLDDFRNNPQSQRHAYLACVAAFHVIDRAPGSSKKNRQSWRKGSIEFRVVDMVAHHFKHVLGDEERQPHSGPGMALSHLVFGTGTLNTYAFNSRCFNEGGMNLRHLPFIIKDAIAFMRAQAATIPSAEHASR